MKRWESSLSTRAPTRMQQKMESTWSASSIHFSFLRPLRQQNRSISLVILYEHATIAFILLIGDFVFSRSLSCSMHVRQGCSFSITKSLNSILSTMLFEFSERLLMQVSMVLALRQNLLLTRNLSGGLPLRCSRMREKRVSLAWQQRLTMAKVWLQKTGSLKRMAVQALRMFYSLQMNRLACSASEKLARLQQSTTASLSITRNCLTLSMQSPILRLAATVSLQFFSIQRMNIRFILPSMQSISPRCLSKIMENLRKISRSLATCLEISFSLPMTEEMVSSMREMMDLLKLHLETTLMALVGLVLRLNYLFRQEVRSISIFPLLLRVSIMLAIFMLLASDCLEEAKDMITDRFRLVLNCSTSAGVCRISVRVGSSTMASFLSRLTSLKYLVLASQQLPTSSIISLAHPNSSRMALQLSMKLFSQMIFSRWNRGYFF